MTHTEEQTRKQLIDQKLHLAGWNVTDPSQVIQEVDIDLSAAGHAVAEPTTSYTGRQFADYALLHHGKPIAVIEAKRTSKDAALGKEQALQYAANLQKIHGGDMKLKVRQSSSQGKGAGSSWNSVLDSPLPGAEAPG